ncbi:MAG: hypothetical protein EZS28_006996 [Streblomastix strix]|uniref:Uncharacterized protein n=1 Tax=Streblomastix strix TaxID=222440 RepID=A0A5J4WSC0_9EUKA|nr:MAG: hypothetical protein EZS28_006996 [Streblomastix strix]
MFEEKKMTLGQQLIEDRQHLQINLDILMHLVKDYEAKNLGIQIKDNEDVDKRAEMTSMYLLHLDEAFGEIKNVNQEEHLLGYSLSSSPDFDELFT